jgi:hypothetical protein
MRKRIILHASTAARHALKPTIHITTTESGAKHVRVQSSFATESRLMLIEEQRTMKSVLTARSGSKTMMNTVNIRTKLTQNAKPVQSGSRQATYYGLTCLLIVTSDITHPSFKGFDFTY